VNINSFKLANFKIKLATIFFSLLGVHKVLKENPTLVINSSNSLSQLFKTEADEVNNQIKSNLVTTFDQSNTFCFGDGLCHLEKKLSLV
jgi:hypothetical protein